MRFLILSVVIAAVGVAVALVCFTVSEDQYAIVVRFGAPVRTIDRPGLYVKLPAPIDQVRFFDRRLLVMDLPGPAEPPREYLTRDKKNIEVSCYAAWRITQPQRFLESLDNRANAEVALREIVVSELGTVLALHDLSALITVEPDQLKLGEMMESIRETCGKLTAGEYGVELVDFRIKRINFPDQNRDSVFARMRAERTRIATRYRSEGEKEATTIRAETDKRRTEILAQAQQQATEIDGRAEAEVTRILGAAYGQDLEFFDFLRKLEAYEQALKTGTTILVPGDSPFLDVLSAGPAIWGGPPAAAVPPTQPPAGSPPESTDGPR